MEKSQSKIGLFVRGENADYHFAEFLKVEKSNLLCNFKTIVQQQFTPIAGFALAILFFMENNLVSTILVFKRIFVSLFGSCLQQQLV